jgi:hypothetical protein
MTYVTVVVLVVMSKSQRSATRGGAAQRGGVNLSMVGFLSGAVKRFCEVCFPKKNKNVEARTRGCAVRGPAFAARATHTRAAALVKHAGTARRKDGTLGGKGRGACQLAT